MNPAQALPGPAAPSYGRRMLNKVPEITLYFWVIKILCTTVGETFADNLNENLGLGLTNTSYIMGAVLIAVLVAQFRLAQVRPRHLLAGGGAGQRRRHPGHRQPGRKLRGDAGNDDDRLQRLPDRDLRRLVLERAHPLGPHHRHHQARGLLLGDDPLHLRARHLGRRPDLREARTRLPADGRDLRRGDRGDRLLPLRPEDERDPLLLARLHPDPPAGRLDRRLPRLADRRRRPRPRHHRAPRSSSSRRSSPWSSSWRSPSAT